MCTLAIFDLDGTILDTLDDLAASVHVALVQNGLAPCSVAQVRMFVGNGIRNLIVRSVCTAKNVDWIEGASVVPYFAETVSAAEKASFAALIDNVHQTFTSHYKAHCADRTHPYDGIDALLRALRSRGIKTAVVSNKADYGVQELCKTYFPGLFDFAIGEKAGIRRKPAPDSIFAVMRQCNASKEETVYIGDSDVDIQTAKNAGIRCISVSWGFRSTDFLREHGATLIVDTAEALLRHII